MSGEDHQVIFKPIELLADRFLNLLIAPTFKISAPDTAIEKGITAEHAIGTAHQADTAWSMHRGVQHFECERAEGDCISFFQQNIRLSFDERC